MSRRIIQYISIFTIAVIATIVSYSQSGRGRRPGTQPPKPVPTTPKPAPDSSPNVPVTVLGIPEGGKLVNQEQNGSTSRLTLRNGLTIIIRERHTNPMISMSVSVKAGIQSEPDQTAGLSRLTRQMILKGTSNLNEIAFKKEVAKIGGLFNSHTDLDRTSFNITAPSESYNKVIELLSSLITKPAFNQPTFNLNEIKKAARNVLLYDKKILDDPDKFVQSKYNLIPDISESNLNALTKEQVAGFYKTHYQPKNTVVTIVGDVFLFNALGQLQLRFGDFGSAAITSTPVAATPKPNTPKTDAIAPDTSASLIETLKPYQNIRIDSHETIVTIGYKVPLAKAEAMRMTAAVLGEGLGSRLWQGLREGIASRDKISVAHKTEFKYVRYSTHALLLATLHVASNRIDRAEAEYFREIDRFRREIISKGELDRARFMLEKQYYDSFSHIENEAELLSTLQIRSGDYRLLDSELSRLKNVTSRDIQQIAAEYLTLSNASVIECEPLNAQPRTFTPEKFLDLMLTFAPQASQPVNPDNAKSATELKTFEQGEARGEVADTNIIITPPPLPLKDFSLLRGPRSFVREDKSFPVITIGMLFQGGRMTEDSTNSGITELMLRMMLKSTTSRKADLIALELENYGGKVEVINEPDFFGFTLSVLSRNADNASRLLIDIIENPFFDKKELAKELDVLIGDQAYSQDEIDKHATELMWSSLFPGHPYGLSRYGSAEALKSVTVEKLEALYNGLIKKQYPLVVLVGDTDGSSLVSRMFGPEGAGIKRGDLDKTIKVNIPKQLPPPQDKIEQRNIGFVAQSDGSRIIAATPSQGTTPSPQQLATEVFAMNALSSIVAVSTDLSLTSGYDERLAASVFYVKLDTLSDDEQASFEAFKQILVKLSSSAPSDEDFEAGRNCAIGRYAALLQSPRERLLEYARAVIFGRRPQDVETQPDTARSIKKADIKRIADTVKSAPSGRGIIRPQSK